MKKKHQAMAYGKNEGTIVLVHRTLKCLPAKHRVQQPEIEKND
jgi:hypothetical protein